MSDGYMKEANRLDVLAEAVRMVADEFAKTKKVETAVAGYVLSGMVLEQIEAIDKELDDIIAKTGI